MGVVACYGWVLGIAPQIKMSRNKSTAERQEAGLALATSRLVTITACSGGTPSE